MGSLHFPFLLLYLISFHVLFDSQSPSKLVKGDATLIQQTCKSTKYYDLCVSSLRSYPTSLKADTKGLAVIMVGIGMANATDTYSYLSSQLLCSPNDAATKKVLKLCSDKYSYAYDALQASLQDLGSDSFDYASIRVTAASDYPNACHNAFRPVRSPPPSMAYPAELARREEALKHLCDVALGIIDLLLSQE
ncbi:cell wall / vacuolar inhibitor of fructosidase 2-like [Macadamia integrifolia]|uniref:cell wall / vacuolar inhibitor of fructosidase 2-like n=1 Tax=Macadamia integrifolia TaxID=60698 RepID=UPI001C52E900|nr:cell wall / vacuolar inhibitor of fructosidase 2-like [Macadamia integrifolia]